MNSGNGAGPSSTIITIIAPSTSTYEEHFIIRFPASLAASVRADLQESGNPGDLEVVFNQNDKRLAKVTFDGRTYPAVLCDLPTIVESHKTTDRSQYVKIADLHQVLVVMEGSSESVRQKIEAYRAVGFKLNDGLTAPMKNAVNRRFNKRAVENVKMMEEVEKAVQRLIEADTNAISSNYVLYNSRNKPIATNQDVNKADKVEVTPDNGEEEENHEESGDSDFAAELEGEMNELLDETSQGPEDEDNVEMEGDMYETDELSQVDTSSQVLVREEFSEMHVDEDSGRSLPPALRQLQQQIADKRRQLESLTNPAIRARLEDVIKYLEREFDAKCSKL